tara:strand:+ start:1804 stop:2880 length:1077 start_codon:yes stop_codon:yes gene_type:complete
MLVLVSIDYMHFLRFFLIYLIFSFFIAAKSYAASCEKPSMPSESEWNEWLQKIKKEALDIGISESTINSELMIRKPQSKIILRDRCQPESTITLEEYLYYRVDKARIFGGKKMLKKYSDKLDEISKFFKIQPRFIIAILGMESYYGKNQGKTQTMDAVTTLTFDRRRSDFYKKQLFATLQIIDENINYSDKMKGSWGGAIGMTQMLPTTFIESGYDWDGGGVDIWNNYLDSFASIANYLTSINKNPWYYDSTWGREVSPPKNIENIYDSLKQINPKGCGAVKARSIPKTLQEWSNLGFKDIDGNDLPKRDNLETRLIAPDGLSGRMFLVYPNYKNLLYYNCSSYYAISIGLLSDEINN